MTAARDALDGDPRLFDELLGLVYEGALESRPWESALPLLRGYLDAQVASLVLRPPAEGDRGVILNSLRPDGAGEEGAATLADAGDWQVTAYREQFFALDPFVNLPPERVVTLQDLLPDDELVASDYYRQYLEPVDLFRILGVDTVEPGGMLARLRLSRRRDDATMAVFPASTSASATSIALRSTPPAS